MMAVMAMMMRVNADKDDDSVLAVELLLKKSGDHFHQARPLHDPNWHHVV